MKITEDDLEFQEIRKLTPQWNVLVGTNIVARCTERVIATPTYCINLIKDGKDVRERFAEGRDRVIEIILAWANECSKCAGFGKDIEKGNGREEYSPDCSLCVGTGKIL